jgi:myo-inositol-1(or 4)-monophosphatase
MSADYQKILDFMLESGHRLKGRAGNIQDIGITKKDLTEEDIAIERGFKEIIATFGSDHLVYGEEENTMFQNSPNVWAVDPISSTRSFLQGHPHYAIVIAHLVDKKPIFAAVYDPAVDEMFTAYKNKGAFLNDQPIHASLVPEEILFRESGEWSRPEITNAARKAFSEYTTKENTASMALNYCWVAEGKFAGVVSFTKDSFPEFAGGFILQEAGGIFTNSKGESEISADDRIFVGGNKEIYNNLFSILEATLKK